MTKEQTRTTFVKLVQSLPREKIELLAKYYVGLDHPTHNSTEFLTDKIINADTPSLRRAVSSHIVDIMSRP